MKTQKALSTIAPLLLGVGVCLPAIAETPEQVQQRLEQYRQLDADAARRRQETLDSVERRKSQEYSRRWKQYGDLEIDVLKWRQQNDGSWVTDLRKRFNPIRTDQWTGIEAAPRRFSQSLDALVREGVVSPAESDQMYRGVISGAVPVGRPLPLVPAGRPLPLICSTAGLSEQECRSGLALRGSRRGAGALADPSDLIAVNCASLTVNRKPAFQPWGVWRRPAPGSAEEPLVIDRCTGTL